MGRHTRKQLRASVRYECAALSLSLTSWRERRANVGLCRPHLLMRLLVCLLLPKSYGSG